MKNILRYLCALIVAMCALPVFGQDYLTVHFKDGTNQRFYLEDVIRISTPPTSTLEGKDPVQIIETTYGEYSYSILNIDSISFKEVDKESVGAIDPNVQDKVSAILGNATSIEEMSQHIAEIQKIDGVENVRTSSNAVFLDMENGQTIAYFTKPLADSEDFDWDLNNAKKMVKENLYRKSESIYVNSPSMILVNQTHQDKRFQRVVDNYYMPMTNFMQSINTNMTYVDSVPEDFYIDDIFNYDVVCIDTHGAYDPSTDTHWLTTSEKMVLDSKGRYVMPTKYANMSSSFVAPATIHEWHGETDANGNKVFVSVKYVRVSDKYIAANSRSARKPNQIIFSGACQTLLRNDNLANAYLDKGVKSFWGYDETVSVSPYGMTYFMYALMSGMSVEGIYQNAPYHLRVEFGEVPKRNINLERCYRDGNDKYGSIIVSTVETLDARINTPDQTATLLGWSRRAIDGFYITQPSFMSYGFRVYNSDGNYCDYLAQGTTPASYGWYKKEFYCDLKTTPGETVRYQAFAFDGVNYNMGEMKSVYIPKPVTSLTITEPTTTMTVGEVRSIEYHFEPLDPTNRTMEWSSSDPSIVRIGQDAIAYALKPGTCTLTVRTTDGSNLSATCRVTVQEEEKPQPQHYLRVYNYDYSIGADGGTVTLDYDSDVDCNLRTNVDWIVGGAGKIVTIKKNTTGDSRKGKVIIENKEYGFTETVTIIQQAGNAPEPQHYITLSESEYRVAAAGGSFTLQYQSDVACTITASENWMSVQGTKVTVSPNTTTNRRTGYVTIANDVYGLSQKVTVIQEPNEEPQHYITLTETEYHVMGTGGRFVVQYKSDVACVISSTVDWITTEGVIITVRPNNTPYRRTGYVTIVNDVYGLSQSVPVIQEPGDDAPQTDGTLLATKTVGGKSYSLFRTQDKNRRRTNPDGTSFYRSKFTLKVADQTFEIDDDVYMHEGVGDDASVCMAYNSSTRTTYMFVTSKDGDEGVYSMEGYLYAISSSGKITKNVVYTYANWGWHPFFLLSDYGDLYLASFSYAGYFYTLGYVEADGSCEFVPIDYIYPEDFQELRRREGGILVY